MMRIILFLATNLAVVLVASITLRILGIDGYLYQHTGANMTSLLIMCFVFGMVGSLISLLMSKTMAKMGTGVQIITQARNADEQWLLNTVAELSQQAGIKTPEVGIFPAQQANAFATGWNRNDALVAVSIGLLQQMRPEEVRAVIGHEIGHVANGDMVTLALIQGVVNTFVMFFARVVAQLLSSFLSRNSNNEESGGLGFIGYFIVVTVLEVIFGLVASIIVAWFSRWREYRADAAGARLAGSGAMINALASLKRESERPDEMPASMTAMAITQGKTQQWMQQMFASHPPLDDRIRALKEAAYRNN